MIFIFIEEEKAKYIQNKEKTLFNDLERINKKLYQINNWYSMSNYKLNSNDEENLMLLIKHTNNIYYTLRQLLFNTKNGELVKILPEVIMNERYDSLKEIEEKLECIYKSKEET
ncbi:TPA: hypothetical protein PTV74_003222 [Clostridium botulinum]|nr:hypothetical protein [Clostridium botulinum]HDK7206377.1 hypothetical protein [Clostridium botulinum]HDK7210113.1 hypothetical protein [Clostridium botulinum]HDK7265562.1 hypothetical protein [Clostridium botulinum]HDK7269410.1 hypothetical protein [Clostridium botulinum]